MHVVSVEFALCRRVASGTARSTVPAATVPQGAGSALITFSRGPGDPDGRTAGGCADPPGVRRGAASCSRPPDMTRTAATTATATAAAAASTAISLRGRRPGAGGSGPAYGRWNGSTGR
ncbi:hypothetical protein GCM10010187_73540 [Actinomadura coerulea]|nr:hypothetical protein GCM10010187_73540 [Actinomadura coerulea]